MAIDDSREFRDVIARMVFSFNGEMDSPRRKAYARALEAIPIAFIETALDRLVDEHAGGRTFYPMPTPADLKAACAKVIDAKRKQTFAKALEAPCVHCAGSRWITVRDPENVERLTRCDCWTGAVKAMNAVAQPLALPPAPEPPYGDGYDGKMRAIGGGEE